MKYKKLTELPNEEPISSSGPYYDLFEGGYIQPADFLKEDEDIDKVYKAMDIISSFLEEIQEKGLLEVC